MNNPTTNCNNVSKCVCAVPTPSPPPPSPSPTPLAVSSPSAINVGGIVGGTIFAILIVVASIVSIIVFLWFRKYKAQKKTEDNIEITNYQKEDNIEITSSQNIPNKMYGRNTINFFHSIMYHFKKKNNSNTLANNSVSNDVEIKE